MNRQLAAWALVLNAFIWGVSWYPFRLLEAQGLHPLWSTFLIYALALLALLAWRPGAWRHFLRQPMLLLLLVAAGLTNVGFNWAVTVGDVVRVVLLFYLMPMWSVLLAWGLLGERPGLSALLRLGLALAGVVIVLKTPGSPWPLPHSLPDWLALMGGFCFALTNVLLLKLRDTAEEARMVAMFAGGALLALATAGLGTPSGLVPALPAVGASWMGLVLLTSLAFLASNLGLQYGAARLPAATTALVMLTEVVFASVSSVLLGAAELEPRTLLGGALILLAALWAAWPAKPRC
ncbi:DMT family transporter [Rhodoferax sp. BAB1]|uniref:DMT family transporter n=1 Tax=Rhodoferax sp. BAB1 TaxID=2741720 RepID=UPI00157538AB|nr:DMT family transporter [Rhodoferax sp. BAB1]QKO23277.1 DMT family transporter [Rhodoferax sp. BAB1]